MAAGEMHAHLRGMQRGFLAALLCFPLSALGVDETRFSPLTEINRNTVNRLRLAWSIDLDVGAAQGTPLAVDGVVYVAAGFGVVHAIDARNGKLLWRHDPGAAQLAGKKLRAGSGVRGLAYSKGRLFVGTHDGRLLSLDSRKGSVLWSTPTLDANDATFISGAPRVFGDKVAIGFGDTGSTRGSVAAYDIASGKPHWRWETDGGGGAVWNAITHDPQSDRLFVGTGNARGGANRFACGIVALEGATGKLLWHFDAASGDRTACDNSTDMQLASLDINGQPRAVILHTSRDGTFHVLDRDTGKALSSRNLRTGTRNHFAQAFSPKSGLAYVPMSELPAANPEGTAPADAARSTLVAWDPVQQRPVWAVPTPGAYGGGVLVTAGDLVLQGQADGYINAHSAVEGRRVWAFYAATAALGAPISFAIGKRQYISILVGPPHGMPGNLGTISAQFGWDDRAHPRRLLTFALDGKAELPSTPSPTFASPLDGPEMVVDETLVKVGAQVYAQCQWCHGAGAIAGGAAPDLRASPVPGNAAAFLALVRGGMETRGMPKYAELTDQDLEGLRHYLRSRARLVTRPDGLAPPVPDAPPPEEAEQPEEPREERLPPGSLESERSPPGTR